MKKFSPPPRRFRLPFFVLVLSICLLLESPPGMLARADGVSHVDALLISEVQTVQPGGSFWAAVRLTMREGWFTYWRNPGDFGLATQIDWHLPDGFSAGPIRWPYPERIVKERQVMYGYFDTIFLLTE
ncbi:MAG: protein-disulfide reductase DsbD domain-containing protein, partial [Desulfobulbaceae bacterium]